MKWESFAPKLSLAACAVLDMIASVFVVYNVGGVTAVQSVAVGNEITVNPLNAIIAAVVMTLIGVNIYVVRRIRGEQKHQG